MSLFPDDQFKGKSAADLVDHLARIYRTPEPPEPGDMDDPEKRDQYWMRRGAHLLVQSLVIQVRIIVERESQEK